MRTVSLALACASVLLLALVMPARSDTTGAWTGTVVYINNAHIGVRAQSQTRDFVVDGNTTYSENGKQAAQANVHNGDTVTVSYTQKTLFGSTRASRIDLNSFTLPMALPTSNI